MASLIQERLRPDLMAREYRYIDQPKIGVIFSELELSEAIFPRMMIVSKLDAAIRSIHG